MKAKVSYWSMSYDGMDHTWVQGNDYNVEDNSDTLTVESEGGTQVIPRACCNPDLFLDVFGIIL